VTPLPARGLQFEIVASLFAVMLAAIAVVAVVLASLALRTVQDSGLERLERAAYQHSRSLALQSMRLSDLAAQLRTDAGGEWTVLDLAGRPVYTPAHPLPPELEELLEEVRKSGRAERGIGWPLRDLVWIEGVKGLHGEPGFLLGVVPEQRLWSQLAPLLRSGAWVLATAALMFVTFGGYLLRRRIVAPLRKLSAATRRVAAGDLEVRTHATGTDEIAELSRCFDDMAASLARERDTVLRAFDSLARSDRLATVGQLAAGVAHEVGNPVAAILGYAEAGLRDASLSPRVNEALECVRREALRIRTLVRQLLDLARPEEIALVPCVPRELLEHVAGILAPQKLMRDVELRLAVPDGLPHVRTDPRRVEQILINLVENAAQALRGAQAPRIDLRASVSTLPFRREPARSGAAGRPSFERVRGVVLEVADNGPGIAPEHLDRIFDPFFTTKDPGEGTGLGLWNAHRLTELLDGRLEVRSRPGDTCFSLILPLTDTTEHGGAPSTDHRRRRGDPL
jgi:signal transduction histidine kinase